MNYTTRQSRLTLFVPLRRDCGSRPNVPLPIDRPPPNRCDGEPPWLSAFRRSPRPASQQGALLLKPSHLPPSHLPLSLNRFGGMFGVSGICKKLKGYTKAARIEKMITVHSFRHTLATAMLRRGAPWRHLHRPPLRNRNAPRRCQCQTRSGAARS